MLELTFANKIEFAFGLFLWWTAIYLITQNPFSRIVQIASALLASIGLYFSGLIFLSLGRFEPHHYSIIVRSFIWSMYLPIPLLYHASILLEEKSKRKVWQTLLLYFGYISALILFILELKTNLMRDYSFFSTPLFHGNLSEATGKLFWLSGIFFTPLLLGITVNFLSKANPHKKFTPEWFKYCIPAVGTILSICLGPLTVLSYYGLLRSSDFFSILSFAVVILPLLYSIIRYNLFLDEIKIVFGKLFLYNTATIILILSLYIAIATRFHFQFDTILTFTIFFILLHIVVITHPVYNWLLTFSRDLLFNVSSGFSVVSDDEISEVLKEYNYPEKIENSNLLRLNLVSNLSHKLHIPPVDALRQIVAEAIEFMATNDESNRRNKQNLKYYALKMIVFDEAEEGQILWELGFDEYPLRVMRQERKSRPPLFQSAAPSDYSYVSRNAYLALKKEAIHNIAWRISYLEKLSSK